MIMSKRIFAGIVIFVIIVCMSGYLLLVPKALGELGLITTVSAAVEDNMDGVDTADVKLENKGEQMIEPSSLKSILDRWISLQSKVENQFNKIAFRYQFIEINGWIHSVLDKRLMVDAISDRDVYKLSNGYLTGISAKQDIIPELAQNMIELKEYVEGKGIELLYVQAPAKNSKFDSQLPASIIDYSNENADEFIRFIQYSGVEVMDLRQIMYEKGIDQYDLFFKTDHHWLPEAGFWAAGEIANYLNSQLDYEISEELFDINRYYVEQYENIFLGSIGKRTGSLYGGVDDFTLIYPRFDTEFTLSVPSKDIRQTGTFEKTMLNYDQLQYDYYNKNPYGAYTFDSGLIENKKEEYNKKALLIKDSFAMIVAPFLSLGFSEVHMFDIRYNRDHTVYQYIDLYEPDIVIFLYHCGIFNDQTTFEFDKISEQAAE